MDEVLDEWISESAPWMFKLMPRHNPPVRVLYWLIVIGLIVLIVWRVRVKRRRERERMERIRREMLRKKKIAMQRAAQLKRAQAQGSATVKKAPQAAAAKHAAKPAVQAKRPVPKAADNAPIRKVRK